MLSTLSLSLASVGYFSLVITGEVEKLTVVVAATSHNSSCNAAILMLNQA